MIVLFLAESSDPAGDEGDAVPATSGLQVNEQALAALVGGGERPGMRRDSRRNRLRLMAAAGLLSDSGRDLTMQQVAETADIAIATAYRHFPSIDELIAGYVLAVVDDQATFAEQLLGDDPDGEDYLATVLGHWIDLIRTHGSMMVNHRSHRGFLERLSAGDPLIARASAAWRPPVDRFLAARGLPPDAADEALYLANLLFDPREILDQLRQTPVDTTALARRLMATLDGAVRGWRSSPITG